MIVCPVCTKENEDFFRFCLGCGADLAKAPRAAAPVATEIVAAVTDADVAEAAEAAAAQLRAEAAVAAASSATDTLTDMAGDIEATVVQPMEPAELDHSTTPAGPGDQVDDAWPPVDDTWSLANDDVGDRLPTPVPTRKSSSTGVHRMADALADELSALAEAEATASGLNIITEPAGEEGACRVCAATSPPGFAFCANCGASFADLNKTGPRPKVKPEPPRSGVVKGTLVLIEEDGSDGESFPLDAEGTTIGRDAGHITFAADDFLASRHCEIIFTPKGPEIRPLSTTNGVFLRLQDEVALVSGDCFRVGQELLRFDLVSDLVGSADDRDGSGTQRLGSPLPRDVWGRLLQEIGPGASGASFLLAGDDVFLGRERGDITFPEDGYVSGSHSVVSRRGETVFLKDLGSSNGTYLRLRGNRILERGDFVLAGQQLFRIET